MPFSSKSPALLQQLHINPNSLATGRQVVCVATVERHAPMLPQPPFFSEG